MLDRRLQEENGGVEVESKSSSEEESSDEEDHDKKKKGVEGLIEIENPNRVSQKSKKVTEVDLNAPKELSRRERLSSPLPPPCAESGGVKMNPRCPPKRVPSAARFFTRCRLTVQPPQSYSVGGQRSSGQLTSLQEPGLTTGGCCETLMLDMATASSVQVVKVIEPLVQFADRLFPGDVDFDTPVCPSVPTAVEKALPPPQEKTAEEPAVQTAPPTGRGSTAADR
ncbi:UNVERIFIED_CONTAM: hypothetical protein FKN15_004239 [Acipenser sinensis]